MTRYFILIILILGLVIGLYLISQETSLFSKAGVSDVPKEVRISNISDNSFTVSWITDKTTTGFVKFGESEQLGSVASDDRDEDSQKKRATHHVTLKNLDPDRVYYYQISPDRIYKQTTAPTTTSVPSLPEPLVGKVIRADGAVPAEALVYAQIQGSALSSYTRDQGNFLITLNNARTKDLSDYLTIQSTDSISVSVTAGVEGTVQIQAKIGDQNAFSKIILENSKVSDLNDDGVINVFDYILYMLQ